MAKLYFRQLAVGKDFATSDEFACKMENFIYLIGDSDSKECLIVDPAWDVAAVLDIAKADDMKVVGALVTHYHPDHIGGDIFGMQIDGLATLMKLNPCKVHAHKLECDGIKFITGISESDVVRHESNDIVKVGDIEVELLHTPGHTPGSICFRLKDALVAGDTLFLTGCGRVDLPGSDPDEMYYTLTQRLSLLPNNIILYPGHAYGGQHAPLSLVRQNNKALQIKTLQKWREIYAQDR